MEKKIPKLTVQLLTAIAVTLALVMIVENYFSIRLSDTLQVQFTFIPNTILGAIAGPVWAAVFAAISDPVFVLFSGQTLLFTWILIEAVSAFIYGWFFYQGTSKNTSRASRASNLSLIYSLFLVNFCL
ncbi:MAG: folate family ECF transporter S component [Streptococcus suis]